MAAHIGPVSQLRSLQQRDTCVFAPARRYPCRAQTQRPRCVKRFAAPKDEAAESQAITDASEDSGANGESRRWASTTIVENRAASVDGQLRTLLLSVEDHVRYIDGRKIRHRQENPRWIDAYSLPGQQIEVRFPEQPAVSVEDGKPSAAGDESSASEDGDGQEQQQALAISSSPYAARRDSAWLDASIVEILTERNGDSFNDKLCSLKPGSVIEVSEVQGRGFSPLFNSDAELLSALEEGHSLLLIAYGTRGIAPLRACLEWAPIQAHCTAHAVSLIYVATSNTQAAYLQDWDNWRQSGVNLYPVYADAASAGNGSVPLDDLQEEMAMELLAQGLGLEQDGAEGVMGVNAEDVTVLVAGAPRKLAASLSRKLMQKGILMERILFCEFN